MRILHLTDLHIGEEGEDTYGVDVRANFLDILSKIPLMQPDLLVVTGDLCFRDGQENIYRWIKGQLETTGIPFRIISGNHDEPVAMAQAFGIGGQLKGNELYFEEDWKGEKFLFLDTTYGFFSPPQREWVSECLDSANGRLTVFMHHPPVPSGVPFMDLNYPFKDTDAFLDVFKSYKGQVNIFCGHYHVEKCIQINRLNVHITPSCFFQMGQKKKEFEVDHYRIALRVIDLDSDMLSTTVRYFNAHRLHPSRPE